jgi:general secretion pathway protein D
MNRRSSLKQRTNPRVEAACPSTYRLRARKNAFRNICFGILALCLAISSAWGQVAATAPAAQNTYRVFTMTHVSASDVEASIRGIAPAGAGVVVDQGRNQLHLNAPAATLEVVERMLSTLDRPPITAAPAVRNPVEQFTTPSSVLRAYPVVASHLATTSEQLRSEFRGRANVSIVADHSTSQLLVNAPESFHETLQARLSGNPTPASSHQNFVSDPSIRLASQETVPDNAAWSASPQTTTPQTTVTPQAQFSGSVSPTVSVPPTRALPPQATTPPVAAYVDGTSHVYNPINVSATTFEQQMTQILGHRCIPMQEIAPNASLGIYHLPLTDGSTITVTVDRIGGRISATGSPSSINAWSLLIPYIDATPDALGRSTQIVPYDASRAATVQRVAQAVNEETAVEGGQPPVANDIDPTTAQDPTTADALLNAASNGIMGPVQIEQLPGLDYLVIRGDREDVQRMLILIEQIEQMSREQEPEVRIYPMRYADGSRVGELVTELYEEVYSVSQGSVSITSLVKPNSILLIGREESIQTALGLIRQLDQPVGPDSQFQVFRLQHASAVTVAEQIIDFYSDREQLGAEVRATADLRSNAVIVQACPRDLMEVSSMIARIDTPRSAAMNEVRVYTLQNSLASELEPVLQDAIIYSGTGSDDEHSTMLSFVTLDAGQQRMLQSGIMMNVRITAESRSNSLVVSAPPDCLPLIEALIHQMDRLPVAEAQVKVFTIINSDASSLAEMLDTLFSTTQTSASQPAYRTGAQEGESSLVNLRFAVDVRTNSIIATGSEGDLNVVEAILLRLDEEDIQNRRVFVYQLLNSAAEDIADAVTQYLQDERQVEQSDDELISTFELIAREVIVVPEIVSNQLIVSTTPRYYNQIKGLIEQLDARPPMVMIEVLIAEVDLSDTFEFGVEAGLQDSLLFDRSSVSNLQTIQTTTSDPGQPQVTTQTILSSDITPGFDWANIVNGLGNSGSTQALATAGNVGSQGLSNFGLGRMNSELGYGGFVFSAASESVSVLVRALEMENRLQVLSRPHITTMNNQPASIVIGEEVQMITSINAATTGNNITNTVTPREVGLVLGVTPRISPDGLVVMELNAEKSSLGPNSEGTPIGIQDGAAILAPKIKTTTTETTVSAMDGQTVLLGGLITTSQATMSRRVPFVGNMPLIGPLFRYDSDTETRTELLIILTPRIIRTDADMEHLKHAEASRMNWVMADVVELNDDPALRTRSADWSDVDIYTVPSAPYEPTPTGDGSPTFDFDSLPAPQPTPMGVDTANSSPLENEQATALRRQSYLENAPPASRGAERPRTGVASSLGEGRLMNSLHPSTNETEGRVNGTSYTR